MGLGLLSSVDKQNQIDVRTQAGKQALIDLVPSNNIPKAKLPVVFGPY